MAGVSSGWGTLRLRHSQPESAAKWSVRRLDREGNAKKISTLQSHAIVTSTRWMLFVDDHKLWRQRFDLQRHVLMDERSVVANDIQPDLKVTGASRISSATDGSLVFLSPPDDRTRVAWIDEHGTVLRSLTDPGHFVNPALSPDEKTIAISRIDQESGSNSIWLIDADSGSLSPFVNENNNADAPIWSADGTRILYCSDRRGAFETWERRVGAVGGDRLLLASTSYSQPASDVAAGTLIQVFVIGKGAPTLVYLPSGAENSGSSWRT